jgi:hypothetical protein
MNGFDETALKRALLARDFQTTWLHFRDAIEKAAESYNRLSEGREHPLNIATTKTDEPIFLSCRLAQTKEEGYLLTVSVKVFYEHGEYWIEAEIQKWIQPPDSKAIHYSPADLLRFELKAKLGETPSSGTTYLEYQGEKVAVPTAALRILNTALQRNDAETFQP